MVLCVFALLNFTHWLFFYLQGTGDSHSISRGNESWRSYVPRSYC
jgi:hypothetical protein